MKKLMMLFVIFLLCFSATVAQKSSDIVPYNTLSLGKNFMTEDNITGKSFTFSQEIYKVHLNKENGYFIFLLRDKSEDKTRYKDKGEIILFDYINHQIKWRKKINYTYNSLKYFDDGLVFTEDRNHYLDINTGKALWKTNNSITFINGKYNIALGYDYGLKDLKLAGINLTNGETEWERPAKRGAGWYNDYYLNDSTLLIVSNGLQTVNLKDGSGWKYETQTNYSDDKKASIMNIGGNIYKSTSGWRTGFTKYDFTWNLNSNVLRDSSVLYFASKEYIAAIDELNGKILWSRELPSNLTSKSNIIASDSLIFLINRGYINNMSGYTIYGEPFLAAFDKKDGRQKYFVSLNAPEKIIKEFMISNDSAYLTIDENIILFSISEGKVLKEKVFTKETYGSLRQFFHEDDFLIKDSLSFFHPNIFDKLFLQTENCNLLMLNKDLEIVESISCDNTYNVYWRTEEYVFTRKNGKFFIFDTKYNKVGEFMGMGQYSFINNKLFLTRDNTLLEIDLSFYIK